MRNIIFVLGLLLGASACGDKGTNICDLIDCIAMPAFYIQLLDNDQAYLTDNLIITDQNQNMIYSSPNVGQQLYFVNPQVNSTNLDIIVDDSLFYDLKVDYKVLRETECCGPEYDITNLSSDSTNVTKDSLATYPNIVVSIDLKR